MRCETIYKYVAFDGTVFDDEEACKKYEYDKMYGNTIYHIEIVYFHSGYPNPICYYKRSGTAEEYQIIRNKYDNFYFPTDKDAQDFTKITGDYFNFSKAGLFSRDDGNWYSAEKIIKNCEEKIKYWSERIEHEKKTISTCARLLEEGE